jgi:hypothetical protein
MLEKYFLTGVRLKWASPGADESGARDGLIVDNPAHKAGPMIYDGLDGELVDYSLPNVSTLGFKKGMMIPYSWLMYKPGNTTRTVVTGDVLTGFMSGCPIALWTQGTTRYVGHVGTATGDKPLNDKVRTNFATVMADTTTGFDPFAAWSSAEISTRQRAFKRFPVPQVMAMVTAVGDFYAILMFNLGAGEWCVGGCKKVPALDNAALNRLLLSK